MAASSRSIHSMKLAYQKVQLARASVDGTLGKLPRPEAMKLAYQKVQLARASVDGTLGRLPRPEAIDASLSSVGRPPAIPLLPPGSAVHGGTGHRQH